MPMPARSAARTLRESKEDRMYAQANVEQSAVRPSALQSMLRTAARGLSTLLRDLVKDSVGQITF